MFGGNKMYKELIIYRNELKNSKVPKYKLIGIVTEILISKEIFKKNFEIGLFLKEIFDIDYKEYVMKSRTMIIARTSRIIHNSENNEYINYKKNLYLFITEQIEKMKNEQKKEKNEFDGWMSSNEN